MLVITTLIWDKTKVKHIYVSPHADDVALSCGGQILANPDHRSDSLVLTVFSSQGDSSEPKGPNNRAKFVDAIRSDRDSEDVAAWDLAGVSLRALGLPEALLRGSFPFAIKRSAHDRHVMAELHDIIAGYMRTYREAQFHFPAGIGRHVDHLLCRDVALDMLRNEPSSRIVFYEDAPYWWLRFLRRAHYHELAVGTAASGSDTHSSKRGIDLLQYLLRTDVPFPRGRKLFLAVYVGLLARAGRGADLKAFRPSVTTITVNAEVLARKRQLVYQYKSQLPMLFGEAPDALIDRYWDCFATEMTIELEKQSP